METTRPVNSHENTLAKLCPRSFTKPSEGQCLFSQFVKEVQTVRWLITGPLPNMSYLGNQDNIHKYTHWPNAWLCFLTCHGFVFINISIFLKKKKNLISILSLIIILTLTLSLIAKNGVKIEYQMALTVEFLTFNN